jgi:MFS family permease
MTDPTDLAPNISLHARSRGATSWRSIFLVLSTAACIGMTLGFFPSLIALNVESRGWDTSWSGALAAMPALAGILIGPFVPRAVAAFGLLRTFLVSSGLAIAAACLFPVFSELVPWFLVRFVMGIGMGCQWVVSETWLNRLAIGPRRGMILSAYVFVLSAAIAAGPLLLSQLGPQGHRPFLAAAALLAVSCLPLLFVGRPAAEAAAETRALSLLQAFLRKPSVMLTGLADGFLFQTLLVFTPLYFIRLGAPEPVALQFLTLFCAGGVVLQFLIGYMLDRFAPSLVLVICCSLLAAGLALIAQVWEIPLLAWPLMLLMGGAAAAIYTAGLAGINDTFAQAEMPSGTAAFSVLWYVGGLTGPVLAGWAMETWNPHGMPVVVAAVCLALVAANAVPLMGGHRATALSRQDS